ncbi:hypothetical protein PENTCL1PPCAC_17665 [Pristionchus entomophagus]|uniref:Activin types I and II receptor domain-containing protein n=1 Tax=Pristionchus entomophagus TaxID=358040 RepID=A0AAV5TMI4_9BILA|nr:hypothetical protein PENTCL1PPCAC_17665 [Pristionchus entomophagus]
MSLFTLALHLFFLHSSLGLLCYEQTTDGEEKVIKCHTLCYTNIRITNSLTEIVKRGCSDKLPIMIRAKLYGKYGVWVEKPLCTGIGSINMHNGKKEEEKELIERKCCGDDFCNEMPEILEED